MSLLRYVETGCRSWADISDCRCGRDRTVSQPHRYGSNGGRTRAAYDERRSSGTRFVLLPPIRVFFQECAIPLSSGGHRFIRVL